MEYDGTLTFFRDRIAELESSLARVTGERDVAQEFHAAQRLRAEQAERQLSEARAWIAELEASLARVMRERDALAHDVERHITIASQEASHAAGQILRAEAAERACHGRAKCDKTYCEIRDLWRLEKERAEAAERQLSEARKDAEETRCAPTATRPAVSPP